MNLLCVVIGVMLIFLSGCKKGPVQSEVAALRSALKSAESAIAVSEPHPSVVLNTISKVDEAHKLAKPFLTADQQSKYVDAFSDLVLFQGYLAKSNLRKSEPILFYHGDAFRTKVTAVVETTRKAADSLRSR